MAGEERGHPFLAMELVDGADLRTILRKAPLALPLAFSLHVAQATVDALDYLHEAA